MSQRAGKGPGLPLTAPQPLLADHHLSAFACGELVLDEWLKRRALANQASGASRTFVVVDAQARVYGYYALAAGAVSHSVATSAVRRNMPDPVPVMVLARLAVDQRAQGIQLGGALLRDAVQRAVAVAQNAGAVCDAHQRRALVAQALVQRRFVGRV